MGACAVCLDNARVRTVLLRALSVCVLWCMWSFYARGDQPRLSPLAEAGRKPHPNRKGRHVPTTQRPHTPATHTGLSSTDLPGVEVC